VACAPPKADTIGIDANVQYRHDFFLRSYYCAETVSGPANRPLETSHLGASAVAVAVARSPSYHQSLQAGLVDVDMWCLCCSNCFMLLPLN
jgi:hypothetical protein